MRIGLVADADSTVQLSSGSASRAGAARRRPARLELDLRPLSGKLRTRPESLEAALGELQVPAASRAWYLG